MWKRDHAQPEVSVASAQPTRRRSATLARWLISALVVLVVLSGVLAGGAVWYVQRTLPQTTGTLTLSGLQSSVSVVRDRWGVPHITASTLHDVAFAQGYVTAQDRLFQMEMNRRIAQGRLAEMFGPGPNNSLVDADKYLRTLDLYSSAKLELVGIDPKVYTELSAYADGVNAFMRSHESATPLMTSLPLEFSILGIKPDPWTPVDSLAYGRVVALSLDSTWHDKYARAMVLAKAGPAVTNALFPAYPTANPTLFTAYGTAAPLTSGGGVLSGVSGVAPSASTLASSQSTAFSALSPSLLRGAAVVQQLLGSTTDSLGSNDWVVDGTKTTTGSPLLANDPHLGINMPSIWYEVGLRGGGLDAIGFAFPGVPGVVIGHNDKIAWGVTNVGADDTDLYLEKLDPANHPGQYQYNGQWLPLQTHQETIRIRGASPVTITVSDTRDGPLLNSVVADLKNAAPIALKWTALQPGYSFQGFLKLNFATTWQEFLADTAQISISQNFVYADTSGNIGYRMSGLLPLRPRANGLMPVDGSTAANAWQGYVPQDQMPTLLNPPTHVIATANNQIVPDASPIYVTSYWDQGYRARRIVDLLNTDAPLSIADYQRIQADVYAAPAARLAPAFVAAGLTERGNGQGDAATAAHLLSGWDDTMTRQSVAAAVYEVTVGNLLRDTIEPLLGKDLYGIYRGNFSSSGLYSVLLSQLDKPASPLFANAPTRDAAFIQAMSEAVAQLRAQFGADTNTWQWGKLHQAHFDHPLASVKPLDRIFGVAPVNRPGDAVTVSVGGDGGFSADPASYDQRTVSSMREILDLSNLDHSLWVTTTGESGEPFSAHYTDLVPLWDQNQYQQMDYTPEAQGSAATAILVMKP